MKILSQEPIVVEALFLGPKSENQAFFKTTLDFLMDEHVHWRRDFHPADDEMVEPSEMRQPPFTSTLDRTTAVLNMVSAKLKDSSTPWFSTRYLGHMNSDTLMVANLAQMAATMYNPNNVAYESSVATAHMELECGGDFAKLLGYDADRSWGHITSDGTIANYESLWLARNLKSFPLAVKEVSPELVKGLDDWQLLNLSVTQILDLVDRTKEQKTFGLVLKASARARGAGGGKLGKIIVPQTRHYSWDKAADVLGIGVDNLIRIPVTDRYRMDIGALRSAIDACIKSRTPIISIVAVVATTEEGAVDDIAAVAALRDEYVKQGLSFYFHVDAAYGGYGRAVFLDEGNRFMSFADVRARIAGMGVPVSEAMFPSEDVWSAYRAMPLADSITIDPHKMGYIPYAAGGIALRDKRILGLVSYDAAYVFDNKQNLEMNLGSVILEGSKSGAAAAGVWAAHRLLPLNIAGYGQLIGRSVAGAAHFAKALESVREFTVGDQVIVCEQLLDGPDFNVVCMAFNYKGNTDLTRMNDLNAQIYKASSYEGGPLYADDWITSHTVLEFDSYGNAPMGLVGRLGIPEAEWNRIHNVYVLRCCVLHPWIVKVASYPESWQSYLEIMKKEIGRIIAHDRSQPAAPSRDTPKASETNPARSNHPLKVGNLE
ncbi:pyridoxal phosphate-dependent decarboxylase family protein [Mesorhizobium sp.]|uniref:pyridoxal phosphate-dependent decarboxylase family protein n=1 Tax=Mesorhizobium sp. TaxID=1871066 RepID=UPI003BAB27BF